MPITVTDWAQTPHRTSSNMADNDLDNGSRQAKLGLSFGAPCKTTQPGAPADDAVFHTWCRFADNGNPQSQTATELPLCFILAHESWRRRASSRGVGCSDRQLISPGAADTVTSLRRSTTASQRPVALQQSQPASRPALVAALLIHPSARPPLCESSRCTVQPRRRVSVCVYPS